jgi:hydroxysqualene dehydroxylase
MKVLIAGAGWAGLACAIELTKAGHHATVLEASRTVGGRARSLQVTLPDGTKATLDNGQHILIGAYCQVLRLMREVGVNLQDALHRMPLTLQFPNGDGLQLPDWKKPPVKGLDGLTNSLCCERQRLGACRAFHVKNQPRSANCVNTSVCA